MVNTINGLTTVQTSTSRSREKPQATSDTPDTSSESSRVPKDKVELSTEAKQLQELDSGIKNFPEVNQERVTHIREALREGSYSVDPSRLAAKIVQFELGI